MYERMQILESSEKIKFGFFSLFYHFLGRSPPLFFEYLTFEIRQRLGAEKTRSIVLAASHNSLLKAY